MSVLRFVPMVVAVFAAGCLLPPSETGSSAIVGTLHDPSGMALQGIKISSLESSAYTDKQGAFAVTWHEPDQWVHFEFRNSVYRRTYQPDVDYGQVLKVQLPPLRDSMLTCELGFACQIELMWDLPDDAGLIASKEIDCVRGKQIKLTGIPADAPRVTCRVWRAERRIELEVDVVRTANGMILRDQPMPLRIEVLTEDGTIPEGCSVYVDDKKAEETEPGAWTAEARGIVMVQAICGDRPAIPVARDATVGQVALTWSSKGPEIDLQGRAPWATELVLVSDGGRLGSNDKEGQSQESWSVRLAQSSRGTWLLPPLEKGRYTVVIGDIGVAALAGVTTTDPTVAGRLMMAPVAYTGGDRPDGYVGKLILEQRMDSGLIPVDGFGSEVKPMVPSAPVVRPLERLGG